MKNREDDYSEDDREDLNYFISNIKRYSIICLIVLAIAIAAAIFIWTGGA